MSDNPNVDKQDSVNPTDHKQESINPTDVNQEKTDHTVPYSVFKDTKDQLGELKNQLSEFQNQQKLAKEKKMEEEGQLKELLQEKNSIIDKQNEQLQEWSQYKTNKRENLLNQIPEQDRIIYKDLSLENLEQHISKQGKTIQSVAKNTAQRGITGEFGGYSSWAEFAMKDPVNAQKAIEQDTPGFIK